MNEDDHGRGIGEADYADGYLEGLKQGYSIGYEACEKGLPRDPKEHLKLAGENGA